MVGVGESVAGAAIKKNICVSFSNVI